MISLLTAISDSNRFRIIEFLHNGPKSVNEIVAGLQLGQPQVSKNLKLLHQTGVVQKYSIAQRRIYSLRAEPFQELNRWTQSFENLWNQRLDKLESVLQEDKTAHQSGDHKQSNRGD